MIANHHDSLLPIFDTLCACRNTIISEDNDDITVYDGIMQGTCLGSIFFGILTLDLMEEADAAAKIASEARTRNDDDRPAH